MPRFKFAPKSCGRSRRYYCEIFGSFGAYFWVLVHCTIFWIINLILLFFLIYILVVLDYQTLIGKWIFMRFIAKLWVRYNSQCSYNILSWVWLAHDYNPSPWEGSKGWCIILKTRNLGQDLTLAEAGHKLGKHSAWARSSGIADVHLYPWFLS